MPELAVPGIYVDEQRYSLNPLKIDNRCLAAFAGIAERGPLHELKIVSSFDEYLSVFGGFDTAGMLPFSVYSFFKCGGSECAIVRIADERSATSASCRLKAQEGAITLTARSTGHWGNYLSVKVWHEKESCGELLDADWDNGTWIALDRSDVMVGDSILVSTMGQAMHRIITRLEEGKIFLSKPIKLLVRTRQETGKVKVEKSFFSLSITNKGVSEHFLHVSVNPRSDRYYLDYINSRSQLCSVQAEKSPGLPDCVYAKHAIGGNDGISDLTPKDFIGIYQGSGTGKGIGCFEGRDDISLIAVPDAIWLLSVVGLPQEERVQQCTTVQRALVEQAARFPGRFALLDAPDSDDCTDVIDWAQLFDSPFAAAYYPFVDIIDPLDPYGARTTRVPPSGAVAGCIVATDGEKGIFHAPANIVVQGAAGVSRRVPDAEYEILYGRGINLLKYFPGKGIKIWGARTLSSDPEWRYINVRRTFSRVASSIKRGTQWAVFEPNDKNLRKRLVRQVSGFLLDLWMKGYLSGSTAEQGFYVRCDEELNPPEQIDDGILTLEVGIAIVRPTEFFKIVITAEKEGASVYIENE